MAAAAAAATAAAPNADFAVADTASVQAENAMASIKKPERAPTPRPMLLLAVAKPAHTTAVDQGDFSPRTLGPLLPPPPPPPPPPPQPQPQQQQQQQQQQQWPRQHTAPPPTEPPAMTNTYREPHWVPLRPHRWQGSGFSGCGAGSKGAAGRAAPQQPSHTTVPCAPESPRLKLNIVATLSVLDGLGSAGASACQPNWNGE